MLKAIALGICIVCCIHASAQQGVQYLKAMYDKNHGHWYRNMTFVQTTERYTDDTTKTETTWYETLRLPYDLRIDLEEPAKGNFVLYKKDSVYRFRNNSLRNVTADTNPFIFFIGGMYYMSFDSVLKSLAAKGYDVNKGYATDWNGSGAYVVGRSSENESGNAIWIDTKNLWFDRMVEKIPNGEIDARMNNHLKLAKGTSETRVEIYINGKLVQVESYDQIRIDVPLDDNLFDPVKAGGAKHWRIVGIQ